MKDKKTVSFDCPLHYSDGKHLDVWGIMRDRVTPEEYQAYLLGGCLKYVFRAGKKDHILTDLDKAIHYIEEWKRFLIEDIEILVEKHTHE